MKRNQAVIAWTIAFATLCTAGSAQAQCINGNSTGKIPLTALGQGTYMGLEGGLYPGGLNVPPPAHLAAALQEANEIRPLDALGNPDPGCGLIGFVTIGFSNVAQESAVFERQEDLNPSRNARVVIVNSGQGGQSAEVIRDPGVPYWTNTLARVAALGLDNRQVQVVWMKQAHQAGQPPFPMHAQNLRDELVEIVQILKGHFPNLRLCYLSSRVYGGYCGALSPEPRTYEEAFGFKFVIEDQINGEPELNWDPNVGSVVAPLLLWGPYLWADGDIPRADGLTWCLEDFEGDGCHPAPSAEQKVADLLSDFFAADPTTQAWYPSSSTPPLVSVDVEADAHVRADMPTQNFGASPTLRTRGGPMPANAYVRFDLTGIPRPVLHAKLSFRNPTNHLASTPLQVTEVSDDTWDENLVTFANAPAMDGAVTKSIATASRDSTRALDVTDEVNGSGDLLLSLGVTSMNQDSLLDARESGMVPRLTFVVRPGAVQPYCTGKTNSLGCAPFVIGNGVPSASSTLPFQIRGRDLLPNEAAILVYGVSGKANLNFHGGKLCVKAPLTRVLPPKIAKASGPPPCTGVVTTNFNNRIQSGNDPLLSAGQRVQSQWRSRDPQDPAGFGDGLTNGLQFFICP